MNGSRCFSSLWVLQSVVTKATALLQAFVTYGPFGRRLRSKLTSSHFHSIFLTWAPGIFFAPWQFSSPWLLPSHWWPVAQACLSRVTLESYCSEKIVVAEECPFLLFVEDTVRRSISRLQFLLPRMATEQLPGPGMKGKTEMRLLQARDCSGDGEMRDLWLMSLCQSSFGITVLHSLCSSFLSLARRIVVSPRQFLLALSQNSVRVQFFP